MRASLDRREFLKRAGAGLAAAAGGGGLLAACGPGKARASTSIRGANLTMWCMDSTRMTALTSLTREFERQTGATVTVDLVPWAQATSTKWATAFQAGTAADVSETYSEAASYFYQKGYILDMSSTMAKIGKSSFLDAAIQWVYYKNEVTGVPWFFETRTLFYRKDWFEAASLKPPSDWAGLETAARKLTGGSRYGLALPYMTNNFTGQTYWSWFTNVNPSLPIDLVDKQEKVVIDSRWRTQAIESLRTFAGYYFDKLVPPGTTAGGNTSVDIWRFFSTEVAAMTVGNGEVIQLLQQENPSLLTGGKVGNVTLPSKTGAPGWSLPGGSMLWVYKKSKYPEAARALVEFLTSEKSQLKMFTGAGYLLPSRTAALDSDTVKSAPLMAPLAAQLHRARGPLWSYGPDPRLSVWTGDNYDSLPVTSVVSGGVSVDQAISTWQAKTASVL